MEFDFFKDIFNHPMYKKFQKKIEMMYTRCFGSTLNPNIGMTWVFQYSSDKKKMLGFATLEERDGRYTIWNVCTDLDERDIGQQLISAIVNWAYKKVDLDLFVDLKNPYFHNAFKLYLRNGFNVVNVYNQKVYMKRGKMDRKKRKLSDCDYLLSLIDLSKMTDFNIMYLLQTFKKK